MSESNFKRVFCYIQYAATSMAVSDNIGNTTVGVVIDNHTKLKDLIRDVKDRLMLDVENIEVKYSLDFDKTQLLTLMNDNSVKDFVAISDKVARLYVNVIEENEEFHRPSIEPTVEGHFQ